jgi:hypothetical protein|tara:strand:- start:1517 stop:1801 length:285 start_codon:yes stop_codon:yes gene_type:complete
MRTFFGLTDEYIESVYEQFFFLKYSGGWSFSEAYNLPIGLRDWFTKRLIKQLEAEKEAIEGASKSGGGKTSSTHSLTPDNAPNLPQRFKPPPNG